MINENIFMQNNNIRMSIDEWNDIRERLLGWSYMISGTEIPLLPNRQAIVTVYGKRLLVQEKEIILFVKCDYCRCTKIEKGLYGYFVCSSCGATI